MFTVFPMEPERSVLIDRPRGIGAIELALPAEVWFRGGVLPVRFTRVDLSPLIGIAACSFCQTYRPIVTEGTFNRMVCAVGRRRLDRDRGSHGFFNPKRISYPVPFIPCGELYLS